MSESDPPSESPEQAPPEGTVREISAEEFNPYGTAVVTGIYFGILVLMWIFMYFVEYAGHGPTIIR